MKNLKKFKNILRKMYLSFPEFFIILRNKTIENNTCKF